jgi:hypothetical protein
VYPRVTLTQATAIVASLRNTVRAQGREVSAEDLACPICGTCYPSPMQLVLHIEQHEAVGGEHDAR